MAKASEKEACECNSGCRHTKCKAVSGLLLLVSGAALLAFALGYIPVMTAHIIAGVGLGLVGISKLVHALKLCPACN